MRSVFILASLTVMASCGPKYDPPLGTGFEYVNQDPRVEYVGRDACKDCHSQAYEVWSKTGHAHATDSIVNPKERAGIQRHFDPELEIVTIATPSGAHLEPALAAAAAGKHLIVEKPIEITVERIDRQVARRGRHRQRTGCRRHGPFHGGTGLRRRGAR